MARGIQLQSHWHEEHQWKTPTGGDNEFIYIVGGWTNQIEKILVKLDHLPRVRGENKKYLSCHHLVISCSI